VSAVDEALPSVVCPVVVSVPPTTVLPDTVSAVADAVARVVWPVIVVVARVTVDVAVRVPATRLVVVALVAVRLVKNPVIAVRRPVKKLVLVALVVDALVAKKLVAVAEVNIDDDPLRLEKVPVVELRVVIVPDAELRLVIVPDAEARSEIVALVIVVVARVTVDVAVRVPATRLVVVALEAIIPLRKVLIPAND
jgi:hypothetical protein